MLYLLPKEKLIDYLYEQGYPPRKILHLSSRVKGLMNYSNEISLIAYCLMPNHFHLLLEQTNEMSMTNFMTSLMIKYAIYYSRKYHHVGPLFQGRYKAINVLNETYFRVVFNYIHENPRSLIDFQNNPETYPWSSINDYKDEFAGRPWITKTRAF
jgi:REP element-mobilizing transposase RayT